MDASARDQRILSLQPLTKRRVSARIKRTPSLSYLRDDLEGMAIVALIETLDVQPDATDAYLTTTIDHAIADAILADSPVGPSVRTKHRQIAEGSFEPLTFEPLDGDAIAAPEDRSAELLSDIHDACGDDSLNRAIVDLLTQGFSAAQTAKQLNLTPATVRNRRNQIEERYEQAL
jgi:DNA-directed RNA polymerase specialized sigma24 family protein